MRALFLYSGMTWSGAARAFATAASGLASRGAHATIVCRKGSLASGEFAASGLEVVMVAAGSSVTADSFRLRGVLKDATPDVAFVHTEQEHLAVSSAMRLGHRGAVIRRMEAGAIPAETRSGRWASKFAASRLLFSTEADRARAAVTESAFVAPLGVDVARVESAREQSRRMLSVDARTQLIVCVMDGSTRIRITTALRTLALLAERHPMLRMIMVGSAVDADDMRMHSAALGVTPLVRFLGVRADMPEVLAAADVGWVAADHDDGAYACLDFMAARVPVIAERSPIVSHHVPDGIAGVLLPHGDPSDTASAVARFLKDEAKRVAMGNAGNNRVRRDFGLTPMIDGFAAAAEAATGGSIRKAP